MNSVVGQAVRTIPGAQEAAVTVKRGAQRYRTIAATGELALRVDAIQYRVNEGPCLTSLLSRDAVRCDDVATDPRWPEFGPQAGSDTEVVSMMSHGLFLEDEDTIGALNLYSRLPAAFAGLELSVLDGLATHCAVALTRAAEREQNQHLRRALDSNREIGIAVGILMASRLIPEEQAFEVLRIASQRSHRKLHQIARVVLETGELPLP
ncbi:MAG: hypothetical protein JWO63_3071 [Frankiales bacterium]|jgi:GAF domain-containing protein|nr:hypothetical protein [Frankiales bacterium]